MTDPAVAIIGIGIHPFGRHDGVSGRAQGAYAARAALADAGVSWTDIQFAFGGSHSAGDADTLVSDLGLTGLPFINVANGCATGGSALTTAASAIRAGAYDVGLAIGFDKHPRGAFNADPEAMGLGSWYGGTGLMLTTQFFAMKIQRYMHDYGISAQTLAKVAKKAFDNGSLNPNAWRRTPLSEEEIASSLMISHPLTQYMFCSPGEGAVALVVCRGDRARHYTDRPVFLRAATLRSRRFGSFEVFSPWLSIERGDSPTVDASRAAYEQAGLGPRDIEVAQIQDTESGAEVMHMAEKRALRARRAGAPHPRWRHGDRRRAAHQHRRRLLGQRRADGCLGPAAGLRERRAAPRRCRAAPGPRPAEDRLHARLRGAGHQRVHGVDPLTLRR